MSKFISKATFVSASGYAGALAMAQRGLLYDSLESQGLVTGSNRTTVTATSALTLDQCGILLVDASAGDVDLTLPASGLTADEAAYTVVRLDTTENQMTLLAAGADTINGQSGLIVLPGANVQLKMPAGATVWRTFGLTANPVVSSINGAQLAGNRNKIINPFTENQRALTSVGDDAYCLDRWYVLTETGNVTVAQIDDPESGAPKGIRLTQPDAVVKRIGLATIIEAKNIKAYRGAAMNFFMRVKPSFAGNVRYAILEHTGTADAVTSDVVNNWTSATFTAGNFFIAGLNVIKTGVVSPGAATYGDINEFGVLGAGLNNLILFVWTEGTIAQNATLDLNRPQLEPGMAHTPHEWRLNELALAQRYYENLVYDSNSAAMASSIIVTPSNSREFWFFKETKRVAPTVSLVTGAWVNATPNIYAMPDRANFENGANYFYANGTPGNIALSASAEL